MKYWKVNAIEVKPSEGEFANVVYIIHWSRIGTQEVDGKEYVESIIGTYTCPAPGEQFTPYEDLTEAQVVSWLDAGLDSQWMDESIDDMIAKKINPPVVLRPLPWE